MTIRQTIYRYTAALLFALPLVLVSCVYDNEVMVAEENRENVKMGFIMSVKGALPAASTRGVPTQGGEYTELGNDLENTIDIANNDFEVYFYSAAQVGDIAANTFIGKLNVTNTIDVTNNDPTGDALQKDYYIEGRVDEFIGENAAYDISRNPFRIVVMANLNKWYKNAAISQGDGLTAGTLPGYPDMESNTDRARVEQQLFPDYTQANGNDIEYFIAYTDRQRRYHFTANNMQEVIQSGNQNPEKGYYCESADKLIPMWGIHTYPATTFEVDKVTKLDTPVDMLRAFAKIELILELNGNEMTVIDDKVQLKGYRYLFRMQQNEDEVKENSWNTFADFTNPNQQGGHVRDNDNQENYRLFLKKQPVEDGEPIKYILYIPENLNQNGNAGNGTDNVHTSLIFSIKFGEEAQREITIPFTDNLTDNGTRFNILRNHIYRFKVRVNPDNYKVWYQGTAWHKVTNQDIEFGGEYTEPDGYVNETNQ